MLLLLLLPCLLPFTGQLLAQAHFPHDALPPDGRTHARVCVCMCASLCECMCVFAYVYMGVYGCARFNK